MFMVAGSCIATVMVNNNYETSKCDDDDGDDDDDADGDDDDAKVLNYHHRLSDTHEMPDWVSSIFLQWLPWLLRFFVVVIFLLFLLFTINGPINEDRLIEQTSCPR